MLTTNTNHPQTVEEIVQRAKDFCRISEEDSSVLLECLNAMPKNLVLKFFDIIEEMAEIDSKFGQTNFQKVTDKSLDNYKG